MRWTLLALIAAFHIGLICLLALAFAPKTVQSVEDATGAAFNVAPPEPVPPPPENRPEPDQGAQGEPGKEAIAASNSAPKAPLPKPTPTPLPPVSSTGDASRSGARERGEGTGAAGEGPGTGSGNEGVGRGGVAVSKPEHISGAITNARDYPIPPGGRKARRGTQVIVRVIVDVNGRARDCSIYRASPDPAAARLTCQLDVERLGFRPARDALGNAVPAPFYWRQRWF